VQTLLTIKDKR